MKERVLIWDRPRPWHWLPRLITVDHLKLQWKTEALLLESTAHGMSSAMQELAYGPALTVVNHDTRIGYPTDWHPSFGTRHVNILDDTTTMHTIEGGVDPHED